MAQERPEQQHQPQQRPAAAEPFLAGLRRRLGGRPDTEHEQALTRLIVVPAMLAYMLWAPFPPEDAAWVRRVSLLIFAAGMAWALLVALDILWRPGVSHARRFLSLLADVAGIAASMLAGGTTASVFFPLLLWIILGYGFRYGRAYLILAAAASIASFSTVLALSPDWQRAPFVDMAMLIALVILPAYFAVLLGKLTHAVQRAEEASRAKSHFLAAMSHEFRTPLNAVIGMSDVLATTRLDGEQRDMVATVRTAATGLLSLVDDVLDLARLEARRFTVDDVPFDLHDLLAAVRHLLFHAAAEKGLYLRLRLDPDTPYRLRGGARALRQILLNLLGNAIRFTEAGGIVIDVRPVAAPSAAVPADAVRLRIEVRDTGLGLSAAAQARVFERFSQAEETRRKVAGGTGLGLSIVRELAELMGGEIGVESVEGRGSRFWVELPLAVAPADSTAAGPGEGLDDAGGGEVVVLASREAAATVLDRLARLGHRGRAVASAEAAAELARGRERSAAALLVVRDVGRHPPDVAALAAAVVREGGPEPIDIVTLAVAGGRAEALPDVTLADLDEAAEDGSADERLRLCLRAALRRPASSAPGPPALPRPRRPLSILVAEDNRTNQKVVSRLLEHAGHTVRIVPDGQGAVDALDEGGFDAVLMDVNMPEMDGIEAVKLLRFLHPPAELPPILALSADATPDTEAACRAVGFSGYLTKPVDTFALLRTLEEVTERRRPAVTGATLRLVKPAPTAAADGSPPAGSAPRPAKPFSGAAEGATPPRPAAAVLDGAKFASLARLDTGDGFLAQLIDEFLADGAGIVARISRAAAAGDARAFRDEAHALRSSAAYLGATALFDLCLGWRAIDDDALILRGTVEVARLEREFDRLRAALLAARPGPATGAAGRSAGAS